MTILGIELPWARRARIKREIAAEMQKRRDRFEHDLRQWEEERRQRILDVMMKQRLERIEEMMKGRWEDALQKYLDASQAIQGNEYASGPVCMISLEGAVPVLPVKSVRVEQEHDDCP